MDIIKKKYLAILTLVFLLTFILQEFRMADQRHRFLKKQADLEIEVQKLAYRFRQIETQNGRSFVNNQKIAHPVVFCGDTLDMSDHFIRERVEREFYSLLGDQGQLQLYMKRTQRFLPMIEYYLQSAKLPDDLKYIAVHESALLPKIRSRSNAVGLWQFMYHTGRLYKLKINRYIDERRHPEKATQAAIRFLKDLHHQFYDWPLVLAAYNGGQGRISRSIKKHRSNNLIDLSLPEETERYYFKIVATKIIVSQPAAFGFKLNSNDFFHTPKTIDFELKITENRRLLEEIASSLDMSLVALKEFNPQLINTYLVPGTYNLKIPLKKYEQLQNQRNDSEGITDVGETGLRSSSNPDNQLTQTMEPQSR